MELYTDASASKGFGGYYTGKWFSSAWSEDLPLVSDKTLSIAFLELYPIVISAMSTKIASQHGILYLM
jgi:hypothetical protein